MGMLMWICGMTRKDNTRNEPIRWTRRVAQASKKITARRLNWCRHMKRRDEEHVMTTMLKTGIRGKRTKERPKTRWKYS